MIVVAYLGGLVVLKIEERLFTPDQSGQFFVVDDAVLRVRRYAVTRAACSIQKSNTVAIQDR